MMPISLTLPDQMSESAQATHILQGLEGLQLQLTGNIGGGGIQISGLDPSVFNQTVQIDTNLLQQLQQQGNINITINPNVLTQGIQTADPNLVQNIQVILLISTGQYQHHNQPQCTYTGYTDSRS